MRTGRSLTVSWGGGVGASQKKFWGKKFELKKIWIKKNWIKKISINPPEKIGDPPKNWRPPKKLETPWNIGDPPKKLETPPQNWRHSPEKLETPCEQNEWQTGVKILPWPTTSLRPVINCAYFPSLFLLCVSHVRSIVDFRNSRSLYYWHFRIA